MKYFQIIIIGLSLSLFNIQSNSAQTVNKSTNVYKTSIRETPDPVKETLKKYSEYKISSTATYTTMNKKTVYKFKVKKGNWSHFILIDQKGKVIGIETGEHSGS